MALTAPNQERSVDPYSNDRFSSVINRLSRTVTAGEDAILFPDESFNIDRFGVDSTSDYKAVYIDHGLAIKDDLLIHITEDDYELDFTDDDFYVDSSPGMDTTGWYYVVLHYNYSRSFPSPKSYYMIIKDTDTYYTGNEDAYIFLAAVHIVYSVSLMRYEISNADGSVLYYDPNDPTIKRPVLNSNGLGCIDGGELV